MLSSLLILAQLPVLTGVVESRIDGAPDEPFGFVSGLALTRERAVWVVDIRANMVHLVNVDGTVPISVGQKGDGPGDLNGPCCPRVTRDGRLWIRNYTTRIEVFGPDRSGRFVFERRIALSGLPRADFVGAPAVLMSGERLVMTTIRPSHGLAVFDADGSLMNHRQFPVLDDGRASMVFATIPPDDYGEGRTMAMQIPYTPVSRVAVRSDGWYAQVHTGRYDVTLHRTDGEMVKRIIRSDVEGPELTNGERRAGETFLSRWAEGVRRIGGSIPDVELPPRKPPVENLWFDADNRLWVQRNMDAEPGFVEADVYDSLGNSVFRARWPRGSEVVQYPAPAAGSIDLSDGAAAGLVAWGVERGAFGEHLLVRLRFRY